MGPHSKLTSGVWLFYNMIGGICILEQMCLQWKAVSSDRAEIRLLFLQFLELVFLQDVKCLLHRTITLGSRTIHSKLSSVIKCLCLFSCWLFPNSRKIECDAASLFRSSSTACWRAERCVNWRVGLKGWGNSLSNCRYFRQLIIL